MTRLGAVVFVGLAVGLSAGCGGNSKYAPVSGQVLVDGKPREGLVVVFQPIGSQENPNPGKGSSARTDAQGRFTLSVDENTPGAIVGNHKVAIFTALSDKELRGPTGDEAEVGSPDGAAPGPKETIPPRYNDMTELTFTVPEGGTDTANFDLKTK